MDEEEKNEGSPKFTSKFVSHAHTPEEAAEEAARRKIIAAAGVGAKRKSADILTYAKKIVGKGRLGRTTAEEDITALNYVLDGLVGGMDELADTDVRPQDELNLIHNWEAFKKWAPEEAAKVESHMVEIEEKATLGRAAINEKVRTGELTEAAAAEERWYVQVKFPNEVQKVSQLEAWLSLAKEGLQKALTVPPGVADDLHSR